MATAVRTKENNCDFPLYKTPIRTPSEALIRCEHEPSLELNGRYFLVRHGMLSSATLNDFALYSNSNHKNLKFTGTTSIHDLPMYGEAMGTPIRLNKNRFITPGSIQRRRALGLVNHNHPQISQFPSSDDLSATMLAGKEVNHKHDEPVVLEAPEAQVNCSHPEDDLPHASHCGRHCEDTFDDLMPADERIERLVMNQTNGVNIFAFTGGIDNTIRCQSPVCSRVDIATLLNILD